MRSAVIAILLGALSIISGSHGEILHQQIDLAIPTNQYGLWTKVETGATSATVTGTPPRLPNSTVIAGYGSFGAGTAQFGAQEGAWKLNSSNYVGFKFKPADGMVHYGWARIDVGVTIVIELPSTSA